MPATLTINDPKKNGALTDTKSPKTAKPNVIERLFTKIKAKRQATKIMRSINEVKKIEARKKQAKSFDDFLDEL